MALRITDAARDMVLELRSREHEPEGLGLWVEVIGVDLSGFAYDMAFLRLDEVEPTDEARDHDGLTVVVPSHSVAALDGATIELDGKLGGGLQIDNPNSPSPLLGTPPAELHGDVSERVTQVIDQQINPAVASHGGSCELIAVEGDTAYVRLGGGCVGCGMSSVTLKQGIVAAITASVPEVVNVVDQTDHASGTNPYYAVS